MKTVHIAAKEKWARKMASITPQSTRAETRLPPGQRLVHNFPVLDLGVQPSIPLEQWSLRVQGLVEKPLALTWKQFIDLPQVSNVSDFHCVTTWSQFDMPWQGVTFLTIAELVQPKAETTHIFFKGYDGYTTSNPLEVCLDDDVIIAHSWKGAPLTLDHGGPARVIIPKRYAWKGTKWIQEITFLDRDTLGFWELRGYSNTADPWKEDRFS